MESRVLRCGRVEESAAEDRVSKDRVSEASGRAGIQMAGTCRHPVHTGSAVAPSTPCPRSTN